MVSPTQWTWVWANSGRWWRTGKPGVLQSMRACMLNHFSHIQLFATLLTVALQMSMGFFRQEYWSKLPCPSPGDLPDLEIKLESACASYIAGGFFFHWVTWEAAVPGVAKSQTRLRDWTATKAPLSQWLKLLVTLSFICYGSSYWHFDFVLYLAKYIYTYINTHKHIHCWLNVQVINRIFLKSRHIWLTSHI